MATPKLTTPPPPTVGGLSGDAAVLTAELEHAKAQVEQLLAFKQKWLAAQHDLETRLRAAREEATVARATLDAEVIQLAEAAEVR